MEEDMEAPVRCFCKETLNSLAEMDAHIRKHVLASRLTAEQIQNKAPRGHLDVCRLCGKLMQRSSIERHFSSYHVGIHPGTPLPGTQQECARLSAETLAATSRNGNGPMRFSSRSSSVGGGNKRSRPSSSFEQEKHEAAEEEEDDDSESGEEDEQTVSSTSSSEASDKSVVAARPPPPPAAAAAAASTAVASKKRRSSAAAAAPSLATTTTSQSKSSKSKTSASKATGAAEEEDLFANAATSLVVPFSCARYVSAQGTCATKLLASRITRPKRLLPEQDLSATSTATAEDDADSSLCLLFEPAPTPPQLRAALEAALAQATTATSTNAWLDVVRSRIATSFYRSVDHLLADLRQQPQACGGV